MGTDTTKALPTVMSALASLIDKGATQCTIEHAPISDPDMQLNRIFICCGLRGILLTHGNSKIAGTDYDQNDVYETIGFAL